jgi:hypothetical protein
VTSHARGVRPAFNLPIASSNNAVSEIDQPKRLHGSQNVSATAPSFRGGIVRKRATNQTVAGCSPASRRLPASLSCRMTALLAIGRTMLHGAKVSHDGQCLPRRWYACGLCD